MAKVKTKIQANTKKPRTNKRAAGYMKPARAIGCAAFAHLTYADARRLVLQQFKENYVRALHVECKGNVSEMARRADVERAYIRRHQKAAGLR